MASINFGYSSVLKAWFSTALDYGADKRLVDEETYLRDFPERPGPDRDIEEALKDDVLNVGAAWAIETLAEEAGLFRSLADIFGHAQARELLHLAIYKLDQGGSMNAWANGGRWPISRRPAHLMINATVSCFQRPTSMHLRIFLGFITRPSSIKPTLMTLKI